MGALQTAFDFAEHVAPVERASVEQRLRRLLGEALGGEFALTWTDNARIMISARKSGEATRVRLHHMFTEADETTLQAIARFLLEGPSEASGELREFIASRRDRIAKPLPHVPGAMLEHLAEAGCERGESGRLPSD